MVQGPQRRSFQGGLPNSLRFLSLLQIATQPRIHLGSPPSSCYRLALVSPFLSFVHIPPLLYTGPQISRFHLNPQRDSFGKPLLPWCLDAASMKDAGPRECSSHLSSLSLCSLMYKIQNLFHIFCPVF